MVAMTAARAVSDDKRNTKSLKAPSSSSALASVLRWIQRTPNRPGSGRMLPGATAKTNSGLLATPTMVKRLRSPRINSEIVPPGAMPCAVAKASLTKTSLVRCLSGQRPARKVRSLTAGRRPSGRDRSCAVTGSSTVGKSINPKPTVRVSMAATPGMSAKDGSRLLGARTSDVVRSAIFDCR